MDAISSGTAGRLLNPEKQRSFPAFFSLWFTTVSSAAAAYRVRDDPWKLAFVLTAYANLALLLWCVVALQRATPSTAEPGFLSRKEVLRPMVWLLATTLNLAFSYQVTMSMAQPLAVAVWSLTALVTAAGLCAVVFCKEEDASTSPGSRSNRLRNKPRRSNRRGKGRKSRW